MSEPVDYLSAAWFDAADNAVAALTPIPSPVVVAVRVVGLPAGRGDVRYRLILGPDRVGIIADDSATDDGGNRERNGEATGDVSLTMSYETAAAIARGETGAQRAFLDGEVRLGGDTTALLGHQAQLAEIDDRLGPLRDRTRY